METEQKLKLYKETIEALSAENKALKEALNQTLAQVEELRQITEMPDNGVHKAYQEMVGYCKEAMAYRDEIREAARQCRLAKEEYMQELKKAILELY